LGKATDCDGGEEFLGPGRILQAICGGVLQDGESLDSTH